MDPSTGRQEILGEIAGRRGVALVYVFGSQSQAGARYLQGELAVAESGSDLDVGVVFIDPPASAVPVYGDLYAELTHLFEPFTVDLVFLHEVSALFRYEAIRGECVYAASDAFQEEFEERTMKEAADLKFKKRIFDQEVLEAIRDGYFEVKS
jgi:predicted nucleotidyltransferase